MRPLTASLLVLLVVAPASGEGLRGVQRLSSAYALVLDADFAAAAREIAACAPAPREACDVLEAVRLHWRIQLDPHDRRHDAAFLAAVERAIASTEAWASRAPSDAEAWFYVGAAYGARAQWRVLRTERLAAARDGKRIKEALERALALDPSLDDAHFGIGMYQYYAAVAPATLRLLRWLLLLPGGDRDEGLERMQRTRRSGVLLQGEADYQLHIIYLWYEERFERALELLTGLARRHPRNPLFPQLIAEVHDVYFHDDGASRDTWARLLDRARRGEVNESGLAAGHARLGLARQLDALHETDRAVDLLEAVADGESPALPYSARADALVRLGEAYARLGDRARAVARYHDAIAAAPPDDPLRVRARANAGLSRREDSTRAEAYRRSLDGWRALERGELAAAVTALAHAVSLAPRDPVIRYRYARALAASGDAAARTHLEQAIAAGPGAAPTFFARAGLALGALLEARGEIDAAITAYDRASHTFGAEREIKDDARRAAARLRDGVARR